MYFQLDIFAVLLW